MVRLKVAGGRAHHLDELPIPKPAAKTEAETEFATQGLGKTEGETLFVDDIPTTPDENGSCCAEEDEVDDRVSANGSVI